MSVLVLQQGRKTLFSLSTKRAQEDFPATPKEDGYRFVASNLFVFNP